MRNRHLFLLDLVLLASTPILAYILRVDPALWSVDAAPALLAFTGLSLGVKLASFLFF